MAGWGDILEQALGAVSKGVSPAAHGAIKEPVNLNSLHNMLKLDWGAKPGPQYTADEVLGTLERMSAEMGVSEQQSLQLYDEWMDAWGDQTALPPETVGGMIEPQSQLEHLQIPEDYEQIGPPGSPQPGVEYASEEEVMALYGPEGSWGKDGTPVGATDESMGYVEDLQYDAWALEPGMTNGPITGTDPANPHPTELDGWPGEPLGAAELMDMVSQFQAQHTMTEWELAAPEIANKLGKLTGNPIYEASPENIYAAIDNLPTDKTVEFEDFMAELPGLMMRGVGKRETKGEMGKAEIEFNKRYDEMLTNVHGPRTERLAEQFPVKAYRVLKTPYQEDYGEGMGEGDIPQWFVDKPDISNTYDADVNFSSGIQPNTLPAQLDLGNTAWIDAGGAHYGHIESDSVPADLRYKHDGGSAQYSTDVLAARAKELGYDSITFHNIRDAQYTTPSTPTSTVYAVFKRPNIRAQTAMADPMKKKMGVNNILAGAGGGALVAGAAAGEDNEFLRSMGL